MNNKGLDVIIRGMKASDLDEAAKVHQQAFVRQHESRTWLECSLNAYPRTLCYVLEIEAQVCGYIIWTQKSGFRAETVAELEQLAVLSHYQGQGHAKRLILDSLPLFNQHLIEQGSRLKHIWVTTRADNFAQNLYRKTLGAEVETTISALFSADEVIMLARHVTIN